MKAQARTPFEELWSRVDHVLIHALCITPRVEQRRILEELKRYLDTGQRTPPRTVPDRHSPFSGNGPKVVPFTRQPEGA